MCANEQPADAFNGHFESLYCRVIQRRQKILKRKYTEVPNIVPKYIFESKWKSSTVEKLLSNANVMQDTRRAQESTT